MCGQPRRAENSTHCVFSLRVGLLLREPVDGS